MRYAVVIERADANYSAYVPDLPGCIATGPTGEAVEQEIRAAVRSISRACRPMACPSPRRPASRSMSMPDGWSLNQGTGALAGAAIAPSTRPASNSGAHTATLQRSSRRAGQPL
jgi:hypothetical protein